jgi:P4 family phage/plasmid primase-like protien
MTAEVRAAAQALIAAGYHVVPLAYKSKAPDIPDWQHLFIGPDRFEFYFPAHKNFGLGLLLGTEVADGVYTLALDVDIEDGLFSQRVRLAVGPGAVEKRGKKGFTIICRTTASVPKKVIKRKDENGKNHIAVEILGSRIQTVLPPSVHPQTGEPYVWLTRSLQETSPESLPLADAAVLDEVTLAAKEPDSKFFLLNEMSWDGIGRGGTVDETILVASAIAVGRQWTDEQITRRFVRAARDCLERCGNPEGWDWDVFRDRLSGMVADARRKGFDNRPKKPNSKSERRVAMTDIFISQLGGTDCLWRDVNMLRKYDSGHWPQLPMEKLQYDAVHLDPSWIESGDAEVIIRTALMRTPSRDRRAPGSRPRICLTNGTLDVRTGELTEWHPDHLLTSQLMYEWDPSATCPDYDHFLQMTFGQNPDGSPKKDEDIETDCALFNEFLGLTLIEDLTFEKMLVVRGPTNSGKSTLARVFSLIHDPRAMSATPLHKISDDRHLASLVGKLVAVSGEIPVNHYVQEETLKSLISGDALPVRRLYEEVQENVTLQARFFVACNAIFKVRDSSGAVERRTIILDTRPTVPVPMRDRGLFARIALEAPGILVRAVEGLQRLLNRGYFIESNAGRQRIVRMTEDSNHLINWMRERTEQGYSQIDPEHKFKDEGPTVSTDLYTDYREWAQHNGLNPYNSPNWGERMIALGYPAYPKRMSGRVQRVRYLQLIHKRNY